MEKDFLIELTNEVYRLTLFFPKKDPLRRKIRDLGTDILAHLILLYSKTNHGDNSETLRSSREKLFGEIKKELDVLDGYFGVAQSQNWVSPKDLVEIRGKYYKIREDLGELKVQKEKAEVTPQKAFLKRRHSRILEILTNKEKVQVGELKEDFPGVTKRTLRRDFEYLSKQGFVKRRGEGKDTFYVMK